MSFINRNGAGTVTFLIPSVDMLAMSTLVFGVALVLRAEIIVWAEIDSDWGALILFVDSRAEIDSD
jgi:hypothetical protein